MNQYLNQDDDNDIWNFYYLGKNWRDRKVLSGDQCLHDQCPECLGTGTKQSTHQICVHMISCPCSKCSRGPL